MKLRPTPTMEQFLGLAARGNLVPVRVELYGDALTPVSVFSAFTSSGYAFFLESVETTETLGRYSFLGVDPSMRFQVRDGRLSRYHRDGTSLHVACDNPLMALEDAMTQFHPVPVAGMPPFSGGMVGYAGYDTVRYMEHLPDIPSDDLGFHDMWFGLFETIVYFDHMYNRVGVVANAYVEEGRPPAQAYREACARITATLDRLKGIAPVSLDVCRQDVAPACFHSTFQREAFENAVRKCKEYIRAGDIFQVVLSQRFKVNRRVEPVSLYRALRVVNPSPYMFVLKMQNDWLVGSSPEVMVRVQDGKITVRPIAGTRRRGRTPREDLAMERELLTDPKEIAEHVMLLDLGRNDVGRVSRPATVEIGDRMVIERFSHVMHITSSVHGILQEDVGAMRALEACLPAGTVSGAPKIRAMEIIDELEPTKRGPYAGAVGYLDFSGNLDTCIAIRTVMIRDGQPYIQAGAGIVADSVPAREYKECLNKARGMLTAIAMAQAI